MCNESQYVGIIEKTIEELKILNLEHSDYYTKKNLII